MRRRRSGAGAGGERDHRSPSLPKNPTCRPVYRIEALTGTQDLACMENVSALRPVPQSHGLAPTTSRRTRSPSTRRIATAKAARLQPDTSSRCSTTSTARTYGGAPSSAGRATGTAYGLRSTKRSEKKEHLADLFEAFLFISDDTNFATWRTFLQDFMLPQFTNRRFPTPVGLANRLDFRTLPVPFASDTHSLR